MRTLTEAQADLDRAQAIHVEAQAKAGAAERRLAEVRSAISGSGASRYSPEDLAAAQRELEYAALTVEGTRSEVSETSAAVQRARAEELCTEVASELPRFGDDVVAALEALESALTTFVTATDRYNRFIGDSLSVLQGQADYTTRAKVQRWAPTSVDGLPLRPLRRESQLAALVVPAMEAVKGPLYIVQDLRLLAQGAPPVLVTSTSPA